MIAARADPIPAEPASDRSLAGGILRPVRRLLLIPLLLLVLLIAAPAAAEEAPAEAPEGAQVEEAPAGPAPAVILPTEAAPAEDAAWTFRYLVPTLLVLAAVTVGGVILYCGFGIKGRYRVVE